ncbi:MAG: peptidoglycan bridge formation glycyltransferase FemA/FemB family protein [Microbacteriaceae bacterium]
MVEIRRIDNPLEWDTLVLGNGGHPLQLWGWGETKAQFGWSAHRYSVIDGDTFLGAAQVLIRKMPWPIGGMAYVPRGPILPNHDHAAVVLSTLSSELKSQRPAGHGVVVLSIEPDTESWPSCPGWMQAQNRILPAETIRLDLRLSIEDLQSSMTKKTRQYIRKSATDLDPIRIGTVDDLEACFQIYRDTAERADFALRSDAYYRAVFENLAEHNRLYIAEKDGAPLAFLWNAESNAVAFELYGGMNTEGQRLRANYALKWHAITAAKERGLNIYDLGGLIGDGVSTFKRGWTDADSHLVGTFDYRLSALYPIYNSLLPAAKKFLKKLR